MNNEQANKWLKDMLKNFDLPQEQQQTALERGIKALEQINHIKAILDMWNSDKHTYYVLQEIIKVVEE